jgi:hypothetical protein
LAADSSATGLVGRQERAPKSTTLIYPWTLGKRYNTTMTTQSTFIFGLVILLLSCAQRTDKNEQFQTKINPENDTIVETANIDKKLKDKIGSLYQHKLNGAISDSTIDDYYKEIYSQEKLIFSEDSKMLSLAEKLFANDSDKDLFFFIVFTKSMNGSDGYYSEAVGLSALKYVTERTGQFADYFNNAPKLNDQDMDNWAQCVYREIQISRENEEKKALNELERQLLENMKGAGKENEAIINRFIEKVKTSMP